MQQITNSLQCFESLVWRSLSKSACPSIRPSIISAKFRQHNHTMSQSGRLFVGQACFHLHSFSCVHLHLSPSAALAPICAFIRPLLLCTYVRPLMPFSIRCSCVHSHVHQFHPVNICTSVGLILLHTFVHLSVRCSCYHLYVAPTIICICPSVAPASIC